MNIAKRTNLYNTLKADDTDVNNVDLPWQTKWSHNFASQKALKNHLKTFLM